MLPMYVQDKHKGNKTKTKSIKQTIENIKYEPILSPSPDFV